MSAVPAPAGPLLSLIVAATPDEVIGAAGDLPWHLPGDLLRFKRLTAGHTVVVGRLTQESIVRRLGRPLPGRITVVVTSAPALSLGPDTPLHAASVPQALDLAARYEPAGEVFVIGGAQVYRAALPRVDRIYLTRVHATVEGDTGLPPDWLDGFTPRSREPGTPGEFPEHTFLVYERV